MDQSNEKTSGRFNWVLVNIQTEELDDSIRIEVPVPSLDRERSRVVAGENHVCLELCAVDDSTYRRTIPLNASVDPNACNFAYQDGSLLITLQKKKEIPDLAFIDR